MTQTEKKHAHQILHGMRELETRYDHFIVDIFGVLHDGLKPFPDTVATLTALKEAGKQICLLSNSPRRVPRVKEQLSEMGISGTLYDHVMTSGEATYQALSKRDDDFHKDCGTRCWFIGERFMEDLGSLELEILHDPDGASFILNSIPGTSDSAVDTLKEQLSRALERDLPMVCANPDLVVNIGENQYECAGTFAKIYEEMGGRVVYHGKPHSPVYERCYTLLGEPDKDKICAIGDSLHNDIAGANSFGIDGIFNLVGIHWEELQLDHAPGEADTKKIAAMLSRQPYSPDYVLAGFRW